MFTKVWSGSSWQTAKNISVWDGSSWASANTARVWDGSAWVPFYGKLDINNNFQLNVEALSFDPSAATGEIRLYRNGNFEVFIDADIGTGGNIANNWIHDDAKSSTVGDKFEVRARMISGDTLPNTNIWLRLNTTRSWGIAVFGGTGSSISVIELDFREFGGDETVLYTSNTIRFDVSVI